MSKRLTQVELLDRLRAYIKDDHKGSQTDAAEALGVSRSYLNDILQGRREPGPKLLEGLRYRAVVAYEKTAF
jgi:transcriptional regulator with XRE-family HTH domain